MLVILHDASTWAVYVRRMVQFRCDKLRLYRGADPYGQSGDCEDS